MTFSIIIPTRNRPESLLRCLKSLAQLDYPRDRFEVIVVDDGGHRSLDFVAEDISDELNVKWMRQPHGGPAQARNYGAMEAQGTMLAFVDDDCLTAPDWLASFPVPTEDEVWGGTTVSHPQCGLCDRAAQEILTMVYRFYNTHPRRSPFFASNNLCVPRDAFRRVGGFDEEFRVASEDRDLCDRLLQEGYTLRWIQSATVLHRPGLGLIRYLRMYFRYGRGAYMFRQAKRRRQARFSPTELSFQATLPLQVPRSLAAFRVKEWPVWVVLLLLWQIANAAGYFYEMARTTVRTQC